MTASIAKTKERQWSPALLEKLDACVALGLQFREIAKSEDFRQFSPQQLKMKAYKKGISQKYKIVRQKIKAKKQAELEASKPGRRKGVDLSPECLAKLEQLYVSFTPYADIIELPEFDIFNSPGQLQSFISRKGWLTRYNRKRGDFHKGRAEFLKAQQQSSDQKPASSERSKKPERQKTDRPRKTERHDADIGKSNSIPQGTNASVLKYEATSLIAARALNAVDHTNEGYTSAATLRPTHLVSREVRDRLYQAQTAVVEKAVSKLGKLIVASVPILPVIQSEQLEETLARQNFSRITELESQEGKRCYWYNSNGVLLECIKGPSGKVSGKAIVEIISADGKQPVLSSFGATDIFGYKTTCHSLPGFEEVAVVMLPFEHPKKGVEVVLGNINGLLKEPLHPNFLLTKFVIPPSFAQVGGLSFRGRIMSMSGTPDPLRPICCSDAHGTFSRRL